MSKAIASLLDQPERVIKRAIMKLEDKNGYPSHDVRHLAENVQKIRLKISQLGLDPDDTTAQELYHALIVKFEQDCQAFDIENNFHALDFQSKAAKAAELITDMDLPQRWVLKSTAAKNLIRQQPPKKLMKLLSYRSVESMLKRENIGKLVIAANRAESSAWQKEFSRKVSKQDSTAFEMRTISISSLRRLPGITDGAPMVYNDDVGVLAVAQNDITDKMRLLGLTILLAEFMMSLSGSNALTKSEVLAWWQDMDGLISNLGGQNVSLNIKDTSLNHAHQHGFTGRILSAGQSYFWKNLLSRYENQLEIEEDKLTYLTNQIAMIKAPIRQPAFEYVEDF